MRQTRDLIAINEKLDADPTRFAGPALARVVSGEVLVRGGADEVVRVFPGDVVTVPPGRTAALRSPFGFAEVVSFRVDCAWVAGFADLDLPEVEESFGIEREGTDAALRASRLLDELSLPAPARTAAWQLRAAGRALELVSLCLEERPAGAWRGRRAGGARRSAFLAAARRLDDESLEDVTLPRFAEELGISERQASRLFRQVFGRTFRDYLTDLRLRRAKRLLVETDASVIQVAGETGWSSLAHFNATFRRHVGVTPSRFRARAEGRDRQPIAVAGA